MAINVAINGFGRIGRQVYKALLDSNFLDGKVKVVAVNDLVPADNIAYLLKYDTIHGRTHQDISVVNENEIHVGEHEFKVIAMKATPAELPWKDLAIDVVLECTGLRTKQPDAQGHITA